MIYALILMACGIVFTGCAALYLWSVLIDYYLRNATD